MDKNQVDIQNDFEKYLKQVFLKNLTYILVAGSLILLYYMYSDFIVRENLQAAATRLLPLSLIITTLVIHLATPKKHHQLKSVLYIASYVALLIMMFIKILIHLHQEALAPSVTGTILVIFVISLDNKFITKITAFIYALPAVLFSIVLFVWGQPSDKEFFTIVDIYPILILGFIINRIQYRLRFRLFKSNQLLKLEKEKTNCLYQKTLEINKELDKKAREAIIIKEEIQNKNEDLNKSNATKDRFLGIIAHDLKNPISAIWGLSDVLLYKSEEIEVEETQTLLLTINNSVKHTFRLLESLLQWARAQDKTIPFEPQPGNVKKIVDKELETLRSQAKNKSICISNTTPTKLTISADLQMLQTIVRNMVSNAIKFTFPKGQITIDGRQVNIDNQNYTEITIRDNGIGMTKEQVDQLFVIRKYSSTKGTNNEDGTGLGLLLCKEFIDMHKGKIKVESEPDKGSCFSCLFPAQEN